MFVVQQQASICYRKTEAETTQSEPLYIQISFCSVQTLHTRAVTLKSHCVFIILHVVHCQFLDAAIRDVLTLDYCRLFASYSFKSIRFQPSSIRVASTACRPSEKCFWQADDSFPTTEENDIKLLLKEFRNAFYLWQLF